MNNHGHIEHILDEILAQHIECNKKLLELIRRERQYIIHNELEALDGVNNEKLSLNEACISSSSIYQTVRAIKRTCAIGRYTAGRS